MGLFGNNHDPSLINRTSQGSEAAPKVVVIQNPLNINSIPQLKDAEKPIISSPASNSFSDREKGIFWGCAAFISAGTTVAATLGFSIAEAPWELNVMFCSAVTSILVAQSIRSLLSDKSASTEKEATHLDAIELPACLSSSKKTDYYLEGVNDRAAHLTLAYDLLYIDQGIQNQKINIGELILGQSRDSEPMKLFTAAKNLLGKLPREENANEEPNEFSGMVDGSTKQNPPIVIPGEPRLTFLAQQLQPFIEKIIEPQIRTLESLDRSKLQFGTYEDLLVELTAGPIQAPMIDDGEGH